MNPVEHLNPPGLHSSPAFTQAVKVPAGHSLVVVGGQNGVDAAGQIVGPDLAAQTSRALANVKLCLEAAGADPGDVVKWTIYVVAGSDMHEGFAAFMEFWGDRPNPPAITVAYVAGLAVPGALVEIECLAAVPQ